MRPAARNLEHTQVKFYEFYRTKTKQTVFNRLSFVCAPLHSCGDVGCRSGQVRMAGQVLELVLEWGCFPLSCSRAPPGCPHCLETVCYICSGCLLRYWSADTTSSFLNCRNQTEQITSCQTVYRLDNDMLTDHCSIAWPDRPDVVLSDTALRTQTSTSVTLPALLLCPEQTSLSMWGLWWFPPLALAFCAGYRTAVPGLCLRTGAGGGVRGSPWIGSAFLCCDWNLGVWASCGREGKPIRDRLRSISGLQNTEFKIIGLKNRFFTLKLSHLSE